MSLYICSTNQYTVERELIIWGTIVYALAATIITLIKYSAQIVSIWEHLHNAKMPFIGAFAVMFIFGLFLFSPFTLPGELFRAIKRKIAASIKNRKERNLLLKAQSIVEILRKESGISVWPVYPVEFTKSKAWNELNMLELYMVHMMLKNKNDKNNLIEDQEQFLEIQGRTYIQEIEELKKQIKRLSKPQREPNFATLTIPKFDGVMLEKPLDYFFDTRICNLLKAYAKEYNINLVKIKDLSKISRESFRYMRGVGKDTLRLIDFKVKQHKISMKD